MVTDDLINLLPYAVFFLFVALVAKKRAVSREEAIAFVKPIKVWIDHNPEFIGCLIGVLLFFGWLNQG